MTKTRLYTLSHVPSYLSMHILLSFLLRVWVLDLSSEGGQAADWPSRLLVARLVSFPGSSTAFCTTKWSWECAYLHGVLMYGI